MREMRMRKRNFAVVIHFSALAAHRDSRRVTAAGAERVVTVGIPDSRRMSMAMKRLAADLAASPDRSHDNC